MLEVFSSKEQVKPSKDLTADKMLEEIKFEDYFNDCSTLITCKSLRKTIIENTRNILENAFLDKNVKKETFSSCQLGNLVDKYDSGNVDDLEKIFIEHFDKVYAKKILQFNKKSTSKKRRNVNNEKLEKSIKKIKK